MKYIIFNFMVLISIFSAGQNAVKNKTWKLIKSDANVELYSKFETCDIDLEGYHLEFYKLKFINKTNSSIKINYDFDYYFNGNCVNCNQNPKEDSFEIILQPKQEIEGSCEFPVKNNLTIRSKFYRKPNMPELSDFKVNQFNSIKL